MRTPQAKVGRMTSGFSSSSHNSPSHSWGVSWTTRDFLSAHKQVKDSGRYNFEGCKIPIPTAIRYDRLEAALGDNISPKDKRVVDLLRYGMPIGCKPEFGIRTPQKNHFSAISFKDEIDAYMNKSVKNQAMLGPFHESPIPDVSFSPLMTVPKEESKRRVIVDFSFPPGKSVNEGIPRSSYLDSETEFSLPSVLSMVSRLNELGPGCLLYKRDLKAAFRQFGIDPGDYCYTGVSWQDKVYLDTRLAMGLRSSAFCCQSVTELVARVVNTKAHVLVYLDDFGGS